MSNPYEPPKSQENVQEAPSKDLDGVRVGHNVQLLCFVAFIFLSNAVAQGGIALLIIGYLAFTAAVIFGIKKIAHGLEWSSFRFMLFVVLAAFPGIGLLSVLLAYNESSKALKKAGYKMAFFGAKRPASN